MELAVNVQIVGPVRPSSVAAGRAIASAATTLPATIAGDTERGTDMSAVGERAAQAQQNIADLETALERTQKVLQGVEKVDASAAVAKRRGGTFVKVVLILTVLGVAVIVVKKVLAGSGRPPGSPDPYGSSSTDT